MTYFDGSDGRGEWWDDAPMDWGEFALKEISERVRCSQYSIKDASERISEILRYMEN